MPLHHPEGVAIVPPPLLPTERAQEPVDVLPVLSGRMRLTLLAVAAGLVTVFVIAFRLDPYKGGRLWLAETHTQLGLIPCHFKVLTGLPCPSCGMTSSFALLAHGDGVHALQANSVGVLLALFGLVLIPWCLASACCQRPLFIWSIEQTLTRLLLAVLWLMLARWATVLALMWWNGLI